MVGSLAKSLEWEWDSVGGEVPGLVRSAAISLGWEWDSVRRGLPELVRSGAKALDWGWDLAQVLLEWEPNLSATSLLQSDH